MKDEFLIHRTLHSLKSTLEKQNNIMKILDTTGQLYDTSCTFYDSATENDIQLLEHNIGKQLPLDYRHFLKICNGCSLFDMLDYGGENQLYSFEKILLYHETNLDFPDKLAIGYILGDSILIDLNKTTTNTGNYLHRTVVGQPPSESTPFNSNFETWLTRFIVAQGNKYWEW
ncbi:SMI1/KNR4 family protein [Bacillus horti]|uniref:Knr4/Smi1-like domain-containing protein n=1 Tax=Caldalkalibacillus horti TaxID=77523 RepID=A0ABT9VYN2_9BACI|nr:SMI1/KNR4 family protein [Bacillus horti]MDQ0166104.1 hypothetical protein [Bacillus horti]